MSRQCLQLNDNELLKMYNQVWKKVKNLLNVKFDSEPVYGDNNKYVKTKIKIYDGNVNTNFQGKKNTKRKYIIQVLVINNARFYCDNKEKVLSLNSFGRMQI